MEAEARQVAAEGPRRALDQEAWPQLLRLQEPCERGRQAQADPALCGDRCGRARQPGAGWAVGRGQHLQRCVRRQRLSVGRNRGQTQGQRLQQPDSSTRSAQPCAVFGASASEPRQEPDTRSHRACVRVAAERAGRSDRANDRHGAGARQDRLTEPGLQHSPPGDARTACRGMKVMESSAVFQPKQRAEKGSREDGNQSNAGPNPNLGPNRASKSTIVRGAYKNIVHIYIYIYIYIYIWRD